MFKVSNDQTSCQNKKRFLIVTPGCGHKALHAAVFRGSECKEGGIYLQTFSFSVESYSYIMWSGTHSKYQAQIARVSTMMSDWPVTAYHRPGNNTRGLANIVH